MKRSELIGLAEAWFQHQGWKVFPFQRQTWNAFLQGKHGLLNAPTGSGKTYGLWVGIVLQYIKDNPDYQQTKKPGLKAIWITPLRALSLEIKQATERFNTEMNTGLTVGHHTTRSTDALATVMVKLNGRLSFMNELLIFNY